MTCGDGADWPALTRIPLKRELYAREIWFRDGLETARDVLGAGAATVLQQCALVMMKPDGLAAGKTAAVAGFVRERGFEVVAVEQPVFDRCVWRELWRYQLTCATLDRLAVNELVLRGPALLLLLRHRGPLAVPASVWMGQLKGSADVATQAPDSLRRRIAQPNRVLSYVHVADEPADLLRELAVLLPPAPRRRALAGLLGAEPHAEGRVLLDEAIAASDRGSVLPAPEEAIARVAAAIAAAADAGADRAAVVAAGEELARMQRGERIAWRRFARALDDAGVVAAPWDLAVLGTTFIVYDEPGFAKQLVGVAPEAWTGVAAQPS